MPDRFWLFLPRSSTALTFNGKCRAIRHWDWGFLLLPTFGSLPGHRLSGPWFALFPSLFGCNWRQPLAMLTNA